MENIGALTTLWLDTKAWQVVREREMITTTQKDMKFQTLSIFVFTTPNNNESNNNKAEIWNQDEMGKGNRDVLLSSHSFTAKFGCKQKFQFPVT